MDIISWYWVGITSIDLINIARGTTDPGYWVRILNNLFQLEWLQIDFSQNHDSSYILNTLGPLCLWQCFIFLQFTLEQRTQISSSSQTHIPPPTAPPLPKLRKSLDDFPWPCGWGKMRQQQIFPHIYARISHLCANRRMPIGKKWHMTNSHP